MRTFALVAIIFFAQVASAQVFISEIKYTGNEWIEITANGDSTDLSLWKFFEGNTNHKLKPIQGGTTIASGGYAVIANDTTAFLKEYSGFSGILFDSSFSLLDTGESISIKSSDINIVDTISYTGTKGSKNSVQKINGAWSESIPTPGAANGEVVNTSAKESSTVLPPIQTSNISSYPVEPQIFTKITAQTQTVSVGAATTFTARAWGLKKEPIENARMVWAFGDGASGEGTSVAHTYYYPGEYTVILDASSGYYAASYRVRIIAALPLVTLRTGGDEVRSFVVIENRGNDELNLSEWQVHAQGKTFIIPKNTLVGAHKTLTLASEITGLATPAESIASLHFPNGMVVPVQDTLVHENIVPAQTQGSEKSVVVKEKKQVPIKQIPPQTASIATAFSEIPTSKESSLWMWYVGVAFLAAFALLGLRLMRTPTASDAITADDFEIIDEDENEKDDLF